MTDQQIVTLYEVSNLSPDQIAESLNLEKEAVVLALAGRSSKYNKLARKDTALFNEQDEERAVMVMRNCLFAEDSNVQFRAAKFMINERKGRHDPLNGIKTLNITVHSINDQVKRAKQALEASKNTVIDVPSEMAA